MPGAKKNFIGLEGFIWWIGIVEDRNDPEQLGRVRVRCFGWHTEDKNKIPTDALPWAHPVIPVNHPAMYTPKEGDMVFGFFVDGENAQNPAIMGVLPGKPEKKPNYQNGFSDPRTNFGSVPNKPEDAAEAYPKNKYLKEQTVNRLSRGKSDSTVIATRTKNRKTGITSAGGVTWDEPSPAFKPTYPYNNALETESGHALEFDDTKGQERVHLAHRKGTFIEIDKDGNRVEKVVKDNYELVMGSDYVYISGKCSVTVGGDCNLKVGGNLNAEISGGVNLSATGDIRMKGKAIMFESASGFDIKSGSGLNMSGSGGVNIKGGGSVSLGGSSVNIGSPLKVAGPTNLKATGVDSHGDGHNLAVNGSGAASPSSASGTGLKEVVAPIADAVRNASGFAGSSLTSGLTGTAALESLKTVSGGVTASALSQVSSLKTMAKTITGQTLSVGNAFDIIKSGVENIRTAIDTKLPFLQLQDKVSNFEFTVNNLKGEILSFPQLQKDIITSNLLQVVDEIKAYPQSLKFSIDDTLQSLNVQIDAAKDLANKVKKVTGKRTYPLTETVEVPLTEEDLPVYLQNTDFITANTEAETANTDIYTETDNMNANNE